MRSNLFFYCALFMLLLDSCNSKKEEAGAPGGRGSRQGGPVAVDAFVVEPRPISDNVEVPGSLLPFEETQIRSEVGGRIVQLNIKEGTTVPAGTMLAKLFDQDLQAQLKKLQVQLQIREKTAERNAELLKINGISQQDYDLAVLDVDNLKADIESVKISISKTEIRAPYAGQLGLRNISLGSYISPAEILTTIRQVDRLKLEFSIPEKYAKGIHPGYDVKFRVDGGEQTHAASVIATENSVDQNTRTLKVRAVVSKRHAELVPGVFAKVNLQLGKDEGAILIPTQALIPSARNKQVIILRKDSVEFAVVETGIRDSAYVQVLKGVSPGDTVITTGLMAIRPKSRVTVTRYSRF
jgi:membrane fusion protein (multidrug efflux system)